MTQIEKQLLAVATRKQEAFEVKHKAAETLEKLDAELNQQQADLEREEGILDTLENGSAEHAQQTRKISDLRARVEAHRAD